MWNSRVPLCFSETRPPPVAFPQCDKLNFAKPPTTDSPTHKKREVAFAFMFPVIPFLSNTSHSHTHFTNHESSNYPSRQLLHARQLCWSARPFCRQDCRGVFLNLHQGHGQGQDTRRKLKPQEQGKARPMWLGRRMEGRNPQRNTTAFDYALVVTIARCSGTNGGKAEGKDLFLESFCHQIMISQQQTNLHGGQIGAYAGSGGETHHGFYATLNYFTIF